MVIVYFLRGLVSVLFYLILAGSALGALVGIGVALYRIYRPKESDAESRRPRVNLGPRRE